MHVRVWRTGTTADAARDEGGRSVSIRVHPWLPAKSCACEARHSDFSPEYQLSATIGIPGGPTEDRSNPKAWSDPRPPGPREAGPEESR